MPIYFDHEKLHVYQNSIEFVSFCDVFLQNAPKKLSVYDQLDRASTSIPLNIAEGNGKTSKKDRCRFFEIARGSALECAACLDVIVVKKHFKADEVEDGKKQLHSIVSMLMGLIKAFSDRVGEEQEEYGKGED
jgi:four helix bundle protein